MNHLRYSEIDSHTGGIRALPSLQSMINQSIVWAAQASVFVGAGSDTALFLTGNDAAGGGDVIGESLKCALDLRIAHPAFGRAGVIVTELPSLRLPAGGGTRVSWTCLNREAAVAAPNLLLVTNPDLNGGGTVVWRAEAGGSDITSATDLYMPLSSLVLRAEVNIAPGAHANAGYQINIENHHTADQYIIASCVVVAIDNS